MQVETDGAEAVPRSNRLLGPTLSVFFAFAVMWCGVLSLLLTGALAVQIRGSLDFGPDGIGAAVSVFFVGAAVASPIAGRLVERTGFVPGLRASTLGSAIALIGIGCIAWSWASLMLCLAVGGVANALAQVSTSLLIVRRVPNDRQGLAFGLRQATVPAATLLGGAAIPLVALTVGWRWAFIGAGGTAALIAFLIPAVEEKHAPRDVPTSTRGSARISLILFAATIGFGAAATTSLGSFFVQSSVHSGLDPRIAGSLMAGASILGMTMRIFAGWVADSRPKHALSAVALMLVTGSVGYLIFGSGSTTLLPVGAILAFGLGWGWMGLFSLAVISRNRHAPAQATGVTQAGGYAGGAIGPLTFGLLAAHRSYAAAWGFLAALSLMGAASAFCSQRLRSGSPLEAEGESLHEVSTL